ncbi:50S ribosomal protein HLP, mitochondrial-like isoform X2 [Syzygium oleosum]|uniref:50S ribosomal protein HLP, mitochondrial-like isoform X2 n=1 Tax=Syzygium oleosum TaxID=219896 RepID=UPI0024BB47CF|nr:50S ribosomal protein HLP, mitochondrial-like isoform X2 [Syzygium oleosum]
MAGRSGSLLRSVRSSMGSSRNAWRRDDAHFGQPHRSFFTINSGRTVGQLGSNHLPMPIQGYTRQGVFASNSCSWNILHNSAFGNFLSQQRRTFIQMGTILKVVDNSGAKKAKCIQALKAGKKGARLGDTIKVSIKEALPNGKAKKGDKFSAIVVRAAMPRGRCDGSEIKFDDNACVLIVNKSKDKDPVGTRVFGPVPHELRKKSVKILTLAEHIA